MWAGLLSAGRSRTLRCRPNFLRRDLSTRNATVNIQFNRARDLRKVCVSEAGTQNARGEPP